MRQPKSGGWRDRRSAVVLVTAILVGTGATACSGSAAPSAAPPKVIATVADRSITQSLFDLRLRSATAVISQSGGGSASGAHGNAMGGRIKAGVMRGLIIDAVIADEAAFHHVEASPADIDAELAADARAAGGTDALKTQLADSGGSMDQLRDETRARLNEQRLEDYFARARAAEALKALSSGATFATVAAQYSDDAPSAARQGDAGTLTISELNVSDPAFAKGIAALALHQLSPAPIRDRSGYDIVQIDAIMPTTRMLHRVLVSAPDPYSIRQRPSWFGASIVAAINDDCGRNAIHLLVSDAGPSPCVATPSPSSSASSRP